MTRNRLFVMALVLAATSFTSLIFGITLQHKDIRSFIASHYHEYSRDADGARYLCEGSPAKVADTLAGYQSPAARASSAGTQYLRYDDAIVSVGPDGQHPCSVRVEDLAAGTATARSSFSVPAFTQELHRAAPAAPPAAQAGPNDT